MISLIRCTEVQDWSSETDDSPPSAISNPNVLNVSGGAIITYTLPSDNDLLGVKAVYTYTESSELREAFSSAFTDTIKIEGFPDTDSRKVQLISVDKSRNESEPVEVTIKPLTPPVEVIKNSMVINETFGGFFVSWENPDRESIGISLFVEDSTGFLNPNYTYYTTERAGNYSFRGFDSEPKRIRIQVRDKWNNLSIPVDTTLTPLFEEYVVMKDNSGNLLWRRYGHDDRTVLYRGDYPSQHGANGYEKMFDGVTSSAGYFNPGLPPTFMPSIFTLNPLDDSWAEEYRTMYVTIDMVEMVKISRFKFFGRSPTLNNNDCIEMRIFATNEDPKQPEDFDYDRIKSLQYWTNWHQIDAQDAWKEDWVELGHFYAIPPSGALESFQWTDEDRTWWHSGVDLDVKPEHTNTPFRYFRIEALRNIIGGSSGLGNLRHFAEIEVYGSFVNN